MSAVLDRMAFVPTCPRDGHDLRLEANGTPGRWETRAVLSCTHCASSYVVAVTLHAEDEAPQHPINHGSEAGYQQHRRRREPACSDCLVAHNAYTAQRKRAGGQLPLIAEVPA